MDMDDIIPEGNTNFPKANMKQHEYIGFQMKNCVCKINDKGSGFFAKIPINKNNKMPVLFTNNHVIDAKSLEDNLPIFYSFSMGKKMKINHMEKRKKYTNEYTDITIIEIKEKEDELKAENFLELDDIDENFFDQDKNQISKALETYYKDKPVYNISFPSAEVVVSYGKITEMNKSFRIRHYCETQPGSSGSPILNNYSLKVFAIHRGASKIVQDKNECQIIFPDIIEFRNSKDNLKIIKKTKDEKDNKRESELKIGKMISNDDINDSNLSNNPNIYNSMTIKYKVSEYDDKIRILGKKFVENNKSNCEILLKGKKIVFTEFIEVDAKMQNEGYIKLQLIQIKPITNMSYMFGKSSLSEEKIPLEKIYENDWDTKNVTNMSKMFCECEQLIYLPNLNSWNTDKVKNMSFMFFGCEKLKVLEGLEDWNTKNVENMNNMFAYCRSLETISDFSKWNMEKVKDISYMFYECNSLLFITGLDKWNVKSVKNDNNLYYGCRSLEYEPDTSSWNKNRE